MNLKVLNRPILKFEHFLVFLLKMSAFMQKEKDPAEAFFDLLERIEFSSGYLKIE